MGREIRKVTPNYEHPKNYDGSYRPLHDHFERGMKDFEEHVAQHGLRKALRYFGGAPAPEDYMMVEYNEEDGCYYGVPDEQRTWIQVFETVTEGTPCSPPFETEEELIQYLMTKGGLDRDQYPDLFPLLTREQAENFVKQQWAPSMITTVVDGKADIKMGIEACS